MQTDFVKTRILNKHTVSIWIFLGDICYILWVCFLYILTGNSSHRNCRWSYNKYKHNKHLSRCILHKSISCFCCILSIFLLALNSKMILHKQDKRILLIHKCTRWFFFLSTFPFCKIVLSYSNLFFTICLPFLALLFSSSVANLFMMGVLWAYNCVPTFSCSIITFTCCSFGERRNFL